MGGMGCPPPPHFSSGPILQFFQNREEMGGFPVKTSPGQNVPRSKRPQVKTSSGQNVLTSGDRDVLISGDRDVLTGGDGTFWHGDVLTGYRKN
jgi:hypothetical protein